MQWGQPIVVDPLTNAGYLTDTDISCPSPSLCAAVIGNADPKHDDVLTYTGSGWSSPTSLGVDVTATQSLSCAGPAYCMLSIPTFDQSGFFAQYANGTWSRPRPVMLGGKELYGSVRSLSCTAQSFCLGSTDIDGIIAYETGDWVTTANSPDDTLDHLSCATADACVAVGDSNAAFYDGSRWSAVAAIDPESPPGPMGLQAVSCPTTTFCVAVDGAGNALSFDGHRWSKPSAIDPSHTSYFGLTSVSCPTASFCVAVDGLGHAFAFSRAHWAPIGLVDPDAASPRIHDLVRGISCASLTLCVVMSLDGRVVVGT